MSIDVPHKTTLDVAKERLSQFKERYGATMDELAKLMGHGDKKTLQAFMKAKGSHYLSDNVIAEFGSQGVDATLAKFRDMKGVVDKVSVAPVSQGEADLPLAEVEVTSGCEIPDAQKTKLKRPASIKTTNQTDATRVIAAMNAFVKEHGVTDTKAAEMLGYTKSYFGQVRNRIKNKLIVPYHKILKNIDNYVDKAEVSEASGGLDIAPLWFTCDKCGSRVDDGESCSNIVCETIDKVTNPLVEPTNQPLVGDQSAQTDTPESKLREQGKSFVTELFGISEHDLRAIAPEVDIILAAKRHGTPFKIVVG